MRGVPPNDLFRYVDRVQPIERYDLGSVRADAEELGGLLDDLPYGSTLFCAADAFGPVARFLEHNPDLIRDEKITGIGVGLFSEPTAAERARYMEVQSLFEGTGRRGLTFYDGTKVVDEASLKTALENGQTLEEI